MNTIVIKKSRKKLILILIAYLFSSSMVMAHKVFSQNLENTFLNLSIEDKNVIDFFKEIESQSSFTFVYSSEIGLLKERLTIKRNRISIKETMQILSTKVGLSYMVSGNTISVKLREHKVQKKVSTSQRSVNGTVVNQDGVLLPGVNVLVKGTQIGASTDFDGNYSIQVSSNTATLIFSYVGFITQEIRVGARKTINVTMVEEATSLEQIVVIGYGQQRRADLTGSVSTLKAENIEELPITTFEQALSGTVTGVQIRQNGDPNAGPEIIIRGGGSLINSAPLYVVDGVPLGNIGNEEQQADNFILGAINPQDIESISILKDATAKAIYGSRAGAGVVLITTKRGKTGKPIITFSSTTGMSTIPDFEKPDVLNAREFAQFQQERLEDITTERALGGREQAFLDFLNTTEFDEGTDWFDEITRDGLFQDMNVGINGGSDNVKYNVSLGVRNAEGTVIETFNKRISLRANLDMRISDRIRAGLNLAPSRIEGQNGQVEQQTNFSFNIFGAVTSAIWADPSAPVFNEDGSLSTTTRGDLTRFPFPDGRSTFTASPAAKLQLRTDDRRTNTLFGSGFLEVDVFEGLTYRTQASINLIDRRTLTFTPGILPGTAFPPRAEGRGFSSSTLVETTNTNIIWNNTLRYQKILAEVHDIEVLIGTAMEDRESRSTRIEARNILDDAFIEPGSGNVVPDFGNFTGGGGFQGNTLISYFGRLNYSFDDKYYITGAIRRDGSSILGRNERYQNFPSASAAWRVSNERFFEEIKDIISELKLEAGYGFSGNFNGLGNFQAQGDISSGNYIIGGQLAPGNFVSSPAIPNVTWEESEELNFGVDLGLFDNKLFIAADYYNIETENFLLRQQIPETTGFPNGFVSNGSGRLRNRGFEIELRAQDFLKGKLKWNVGVNFSRNVNKVIELDDEFVFQASGASNGTAINRLEEGEEIGLFYGLRTLGLFTQEQIDDPDVPRYPGARVGSLNYVDGNEDGQLGRGEDYVLIGNPNPDFTFGMTHNFKYGNFDMNIIIAGSVGQQILDLETELTRNLDGVFNVDREVLNRFRPGDDPTTRTVPTTLGQTNAWRFPNDTMIQDADYLWVKNITMGYNIPKDILGDYLKQVRIYLSLQNPFLLTEYEDGNPEVRRAGDNALNRNINYGSYPVTKVYTLGVNVSL